MKLIRVTPPTNEPVSLAELKDFLRWNGDDIDLHLQDCIQAATARFDGPTGRLGRAIITQTWRLVLDSFPAAIRIPLPPVQSVTAVAYLDVAGDERTLDSSAYRLAGEALTPTASWPDTAELAGAVSITFVAGYGDPIDVPEDLKALIRAVAADIVDHERAASAGLEELVSQHREWAF